MNVGLPNLLQGGMPLDAHGDYLPADQASRSS
jgi:hypothetical protein